LLLAIDAFVEGVHFTRDFGTLADAGWKSLARNLSDVAAMGGSPVAAVASVVGANRVELDELYDGMLECAREFDCPIVGGDLSGGPLIVVTISIVGDSSVDRPVLRSGARVGDRMFLTGPTGAASAGLRLLREDLAATGPCVESYRRPSPRLFEGRAARRGGATAMIDLSDGLGLDLHRLCLASGVGATLDELPVAGGATEVEALSGGDDYELLFFAPSVDDVMAAFASAGLARPICIGEAVSEPAKRSLRGVDFEPGGYTHDLA
jgi:thiamine-monophosphate kinase